jgi:formylglycine-generating enzyme required for sulfatase activity
MVAYELEHSDKPDKAKRRVEHFLNRYEDKNVREKVYQLVQYAAFPLTLTAELCLLLREEFVQDVPWYVATDILLSELCEPVGYDLYEMQKTTQHYLRKQLAEQANLDNVAKFLSEYISHKLAQENSQRARHLGDPARWIAMACLQPADVVTQEIKKQLVDILKNAKNSSERLCLAVMIENLGDLLVQRDYEPIDLRKIQELLEKNTPIDECDHDTDSPKRDSPFISEEDSTVPPGELTPFTFKIVTVDYRGKETLRESHTACCFIETLPKGLNLEMVAIPSGRFKMGSPENEQGRIEHEGPIHHVTIQPFFLGKYPITQAQWRIVARLPEEQSSLDPNPANFEGDDRPVEQVSWLDAIEFCLRLSNATGRTYRLPSEAEWEYACRAGTTTPFYFGETITGKLVNYASEIVYRQEASFKSSKQTNPVGQFPPNRFGLFDMHGNVWEWCQDHWHNNYVRAPNNGSAWLLKDENTTPILRGGSRLNDPKLCRSASRDFKIDPGCRSTDFGFRVVCDAPLY